jgi:hypothetical protein
MKVTTSAARNKQIPLHPFRRTPGESSKELPKFDELKNKHPFVKKTKAGRRDDPEAYKAIAKDRPQDFSPAR